ncbi:tetratricopeptide repeat protein [candidate division WOR-3 bacterium]|nr:tetratricopeptide repeat protein [candidate division WOR-3 bacterium]
MAEERVKQLETRLSTLTDDPDTDENGLNKVDILIKLAFKLYRNQPEKAWSYGEEAMRLADKLGSESAKAGVDLFFGTFHLTKGEIDEAQAFIEQALELYTRIGSRENIGHCHMRLGGIHKQKGKLDKALQYTNSGVKIMTELGEKKAVADCYNIIALIHDERGDYSEALEFHLKSLSIREELGEVRTAAMSLTNIGLLYERLTNYDQALEYYDRALDSFNQIGFKQGIAACLANIGNIYDIREEYGKALDNYLKALERGKELDDPRVIASCLGNIGCNYIMQEEYDKAIEYVQPSLKLFEEIGNKINVVNCILNLGHIYLKQKKFDIALEQLQKAVKDSRKLESKHSELKAFEYLSALYEDKGEPEKALEYYKQFSALQAKVFTEGNAEQMARLKAQYETEKKEREAEIYRLKTVELERLVEERTAEVVRSAKLATIGVMAAGIAHQVNNPVGIALMNSGMLRRMLYEEVASFSDFRAKSLELLDEVENELRRTRKVVKDLLAFARDKELSIVPSDVNRVVKSTIDLARRHMKGGFTIRASLDKTLPLASIDRESTEQVILNVIQNAYDATNGGGNATVKTVKSKKRTVDIEISNNGPPIPEDAWEKIFEPLYTTKPEGKGTGLGLSVGAMMLGRFGGRISLKASNKNKTTFLVELPQAKESR